MRMHLFEILLREKRFSFSSNMSHNDNNNVDNHDDEALPFAECEIATDVHHERSTIAKAKYHGKGKGKGKSKKTKTTQAQPVNAKQYFGNTVSNVYLDNCAEENNIVSFVSYTGPSNTSHLHRRLYVPQLLTMNDELVTPRERFTQDYNEIIASLAPASPTITFSIYIRFGIFYVITSDSILDQTISLRDFLVLRNRSSSPYRRTSS